MCTLTGDFTIVASISSRGNFRSGLSVTIEILLEARSLGTNESSRLSGLKVNIPVVLKTSSGSDYSFNEGCCDIVLSDTIS